MAQNSFAVRALWAVCVQEDSSWQIREGFVEEVFPQSEHWVGMKGRRTFQKHKLFWTKIWGRSWLIGFESKEDPHLTGAVCSLGLLGEKVRELGRTRWQSTLNISLKIWNDGSVLLSCTTFTVCKAHFAHPIHYLMHGLLPTIISVLYINEYLLVETYCFWLPLSVPSHCWFLYSLWLIIVTCETVGLVVPPLPLPGVKVQCNLHRDEEITNRKVWVKQ